MPSAMVQQTATAAALSAASNVLAQLITAQKTGKNEGKTADICAHRPSIGEKRAFTIDAVPVAKFVLFTILSTPPNVLWQEFLEDVFPGEKKVQPAINKGADDEKQGKKDVVKDKAQQKSAGMNWANVLWKFLLDQTVGGVVNTVLFIAGMKALNGGNAEEVKIAVKEGLWPIFLAGTKLWPLVSAISFTMIPVEKRVIFGSIAGVAWGVYLSLMAAE
ncbi:Protein SYM1 [Lasiodiplodia hormozganensis]|uniref:Protein SYM1 n=1 Tax=Lasiodiplodia hormozganensis TaxID=869390 RepID=A0AA39Z0H2_9PEZI|nr:Protein SYM1 [Lasiodiplodia hormozganensis]